MKKIIYGIYDQKAKLWLGQKDSPNRYEDRQLARMAAQVLGTMLKYPRMRLRARAIPENINKYVDTVEAAYSGEEAIKRLESGRS